MFPEISTGLQRRSPLPLQTSRVREMKRHLISGTACIIMSGCASTQINYNTLDIARYYESLWTKQVTANLISAFNNPDGLPSFVKVTAATTTTQNSVTPTFTFPISPTVTGVSQLSQTAASTLLGSKTSATAGKGLGIAAVDQWNSTYTVTPVIDQDQMYRLSALYKFVTRQMYLEDFEASYPLIETSDSAASPTQALTITVDGKPVTVTNGPVAKPDDPNKITYVRRAVLINRRNIPIGYTYVVAHPDKTFITTPGCILCDYGHTLSDKDMVSINERVKTPKDETPSDAAIKKAMDHPNNVHKLERNTSIRQDWLYAPWETLDEDAVPLPSDGIETLYAKRLVDGFRGPKTESGMKYFYELALLTEGATSQGTGSPASAGQSQGRKTENLQRISIPVGGALPSAAP
jgi:hypothetical protein